jgi:hypothetical protein
VNKHATTAEARVACVSETLAVELREQTIHV